MTIRWRAWLLLLLLVGPFVAYIACGAMWLAERHWLFYATAIWVGSGILLAGLAARWTRAKRQVLPPIDWSEAQTFAPFDRQAWALVQEEADRADGLSTEALTEFDTYIETGRRLAKRLAAHYQPLANDPIEHVPVVELLTALELAAQDLVQLCRQVPGGDMVTPAHWKRAVQAAEYLNWANDLYTYLLPVLQPVTGLVRLGTQRLMVRPAWRNVQQNLLRWFYQAFVNRLGTHLIELYSGRLVIGADQYRKLTKRAAWSGHAPASAPGMADSVPLTIAVAGARSAGKSGLIAALQSIGGEELERVRSRLRAGGYDEGLVERMRNAHWAEVPGYSTNTVAESSRDRNARRDAVAAAIEADLLVVVIDGAREEHGADARFAHEWEKWFIEHPGLEVPPALAVITAADHVAWGSGGQPANAGNSVRSVSEAALRARLDALRAALPATVAEVVASGQGTAGVAEVVLPALASLLGRAERVALIRYLHQASNRSKARRLINQVGQQGWRIWSQFRSARSRQERERAS